MTIPESVRLSILELHGEGIDFKAVALKDKAAGMYILIPKDAENCTA